MNAAKGTVTLQRNTRERPTDLRWVLVTAASIGDRKQTLLMTGKEPQEGFVFDPSKRPKSPGPWVRPMQSNDAGPR